ncbi:hypothetical protein N0V93_007562 [Gnomoniopsis smithogilvyi]|uniref:Cupin type-2 domain-containing protein n=1 Tax=Gnomoniopsis smithogilvyi TaxID=1191159 RepID=A0A9W8YRL1_9PEZI|nr:hypothetical protein N0V93_007562 [Gnomoniopsis smithogilvyi]
MLSFIAKHPPRSKICHLNVITLDGGRSVAHFNPSGGQKYLVTNRLPPALSPAEAQRQGLPHPGANTSLAPPLHRHFWQDESFHIISGTAKFTVGGSRREVRLASGGEVVVIPKREAHTFCNASEEADLVIEFALRPANKRTDEAYFRNIWGYRNDLKQAGMQRSIFQSLLFMHRGGVVLALPGPEILSKVAGLLLNYIGGVLIGRFLLGFQDTYSDYYHERSS